ncbi:MAG: S41 family peptidase, partial [Chryseotalea sp.]
YVWTVISHFYPYKKSLELVLDFNWDSQLLVGLNEMSLVENFDDALKILNKSVNMFQDIHTYIYNFKSATDFAEKASFLPIYTECVDNRIFIVKSLNEKIKKGDEILMIDGKSISYLLDSLEENERGTVRYKRGSAFNGLSFIKNQFQVELKRNNINLSLTIKPISIVEYFSKLIYENPYNHKSIEQVNPTTYYINLGIASEDEWKTSFNALSKTENIIIDLRDYLFVGQEEFLFHFIKRGYLNGMYYCSPVNIYPNQKSTYYPFETDIIYSNEPVIKTKIFLLINANTMSKGEIICSVLKANGATLYGDTTAGAPGTLAGTHSLITPSNSLFVLSTRYSLRSNLQQIQLIGITPDIRVLPIVKDLQEGKDSVLEQVLKILNKN